MPSSAVPLIEPQSAWNVRLGSGQAYWRSGPGRITVQKQILKRATECSVKNFGNAANAPKVKKIKSELWVWGESVVGGECYGEAK